MNGIRQRAALVVGLCAILGVSGCATTHTTIGAIPRLEQERSANPTSAPVVRALGIAYYDSSRYSDARAALEDARRLNPGDGVTALYLGLTAEAQNDIPAARDAYSSYLKVGKTKKVRTELQGRLALLDRKQLQLDAADAIQREAQLDVTPSPVTTVAVLPFKFSGSDTTLKPIERGFAELLTTDLARAPSLTILERARLQAILDEVALQKTGATDSTTDVRAGHLIQAGSLVTGDITQTGGQLSTTAEILQVSTSGIEGTPSTDNETLNRLFDMEKTIALSLFNTLHVTLTTAQRNAVEQRPTKSLAAFLSYSRGLEAEDDGHFDDASRYFQDATRLDPGFAGAAQKSQEAKVAVAASQAPASAVVSSLGSSEAAVVTAAAQGTSAPSTPSNTGAAATAASALNPSAPAASTSSGSTSSGTTSSSSTTSTPAQTNPPGAAAGTGGTNLANPTAQVIIPIPRPPL